MVPEVKVLNLNLRLRRLPYHLKIQMRGPSDFSRSKRQGSARPLPCHLATSPKKRNSRENERAFYYNPYPNTPCDGVKSVPRFPSFRGILFYNLDQERPPN